MLLKEILDKGIRIEVWKDEFHYFIKLTKNIEDVEYIILQRLYEFEGEYFEEFEYIIGDMYYQLEMKMKGML